MRKTLLKLALLGSLILPMIVFAQGEPTIDTPAPYVPVLPALERITNALFAILLIVAAIAITIAAYFFVTAAGEADKVKKARDFVLYALVGVLVAFLAKGLVLLIGQILAPGGGGGIIV